MAKRPTKNRLELRKEAEAAEALGARDADDDELDEELDDDSDDGDVDDSDDEDAPRKPKKAKKKAVKKAVARPKRTKVKAAVRKRLVWVVYSNSMKEEGRYAYAERKAADERAETLSQKSGKKAYFVLGVKEPIAPAAET
jgi:hypothetical protein